MGGTETLRLEAVELGECVPCTETLCFVSKKAGGGIALKRLYICFKGVSGRYNYYSFVGTAITGDHS